MPEFGYRTAGIHKSVTELPVPAWWAEIFGGTFQQGLERLARKLRLLLQSEGGASAHESRG
jgi:hypothetical protein